VHDAATTPVGQVGIGAQRTEATPGAYIAKIVRRLEAPGRNPERRLAAAVVLQALDDLTVARRPISARIAASHAIHRKGTAWRAAAWFASDATNWPFAFACLCDALDLDPARIRRVLGIAPRHADDWRWTPGRGPFAAAPSSYHVSSGRARRGALRVMLRNR
jgi:hypothetical protein